jgi:regulation of enolase protein 1 (concanavalin A-like superfamily)
MSVDSCNHLNKHNESWPDGGIEVCNDCKKSRSIWEQGASDWIMVTDLPGKRKELQDFLDRG